MTAAAKTPWEKLRAPFPAETIGKLPKLSCKKCSDSPGKVCGEHQKKKCPHCKAFVSTAHIDLDYVGHAATTDRLLQVDPEWTWEPLALSPEGLPAVDRAGNLWIRLTVCGVTRLGVGDGKTAKECIGDAIRNAAMRFGVALDLWAKEDLHAADAEVAQPQAAPDPAPAAPLPSETRLLALNTEYGTLVDGFDVGIVPKKIGEKKNQAGFSQWLDKQIVAFENNIAKQKSDANAEKSFPIPDAAKAADAQDAKAAA